MEKSAELFPHSNAQQVKKREEVMAKDSAGYLH